MLKLSIIVFSLLGLLSACVGQYVQIGQCDPNIELVEDFDIQQFLGTWYEIARSDNVNQNGECAEFQLTNTSDTLNVYHSSVTHNFLEEANGTASLVNGTAKLTFNISSFENPIDFWVRDTDYSTFAITFACENITTSQRRLHIWVLGRQRAFLNEMSWALINTTINNSFSVNATSLRSINHSGDSCYILPIIESGNLIVLPGQCDPNLPVVTNFTVARFTGIWHQIASYETANSNGACVRAEYSLGTGVVDVLNSQVINQTLFSIDGYATVSSNDSSAKLSVTLNVGPNAVSRQDLWILATDYDSYAISYSCVNVSDDQKHVFSWILSRTRQLPASSQTAVDQVVNSIIDLNYQYYEPTNQTDAGCFFYPEPVPNQPVVFRGQCNSIDVEAMGSFDAGWYMGLWHNIELYPAPFQGGTCSNAHYEFVVEAGRVDVLNTQVVNQTLDTINAVAVLASTDGTAKLLVTFPIAGTNLTITTDYWVLDTDYTNYALVYSCFNISNDEMQVGSWKLSRTKQLTSASETAINRVLNNVSVLEQRYFEPMNQSVEGCFYFPEAQDGVPVVFPGQCNDNINVVQNFNFTQFQGTWHEIQAYPKAEQSGQCINHQYTFFNSTQLNLVSSAVTDQFLGLTNGVLSNSTNDNSGRLTITITGDNGTAIIIPFWILNTDYNDYALAYSCVNISADFRGIWSWKLSRTKQLSGAANTAINSFISNITVLDNKYYEDIDQSDQACSYLPDLAPGEAIVLPGQCNASIAGVPNFNISGYAGRWRLIESYASDFQIGTCNLARYTLENNNTLSVINSQVVDQDLRTISGTANITSTDGSGKLLFYFPSRNEYFEYIILDTDYDSYALGYGCVNLTNNQRRVYSWKMSRENTLSAVATNNINQIVNSIEVLNNRFYYIVNRTNSGCFYYPTPENNSTVRFRGQCNQSIPVVTNFDAGRYLGLWHDIESYPEDFQDGTCINAYYSPGNDVDVYNTQVINQTLFSIRGSASLVESTDGSAKLNVTFSVGGFNVTTSYWVLATDYDSYSFVYSCQPIDDEYVRVSSWKLSRTKALTPAATTAINNVISTIPVLDQRYFLTRDQSPEGCFYFPEAQLGVPVVFPGQCDNNIAAVPSFNMTLFQGIWHEIEAYPKEEQPGQCINHQFTLNGTSSLDLQSSNVFDQALDLTNANVTFASTDGSGRLTITITLDNGTVIQIPYWVLSTDYTNYALAYSCVNISSDFRGIWSWKLSRTKQLSEAANTTINNAISNINVLDNVYYEDIDQTDRACFYLPDLAPGEAIVLPGQCNASITGVPNFNMSRYVGRWRLIESYASDFQVGTCNVARYTLENNNTLGVVNSQVVDQDLRTISGTANITSTDGSGKLLFYFPSRNEYFEYIILDTDYDSYALGYGCVNITNNQRRVYSWKMSRENTLSAVATNNINQIVNSIEVLNNRFYYIVNRTNSGCFYYPTPENNSTVRFRGQCNQSIPVVTNFDAGRYLGLWHDIESYPEDFQDGTCINAYYSPGNDVDVYNTQVINQTLFSIRGSASLVESTDGSAKLNVTFSVGGFNVTTSYWVLATDYDSYSFVYSCQPIDDEYVRVSSWKLSRTKALTPAATTAINNVISTIPVLDQRYFLTRDQSPEGCFYFPEPQLGVPVVFPGQCDNNIAAVPSFNMTLFQGIWHEIEAYPKEEQPGQCINHQFTLNGTSSLDLQSSNVLDQALDLTNANVTFASTDGSGRLTITITPDNGTVIQIPYWVLSTDYTNYALAYSCVNISSDFRGIWSWKLSRTKQLSEAANTTINNAISNINVLDNIYYEDIDQTDRACFYLPDLAPGEAIVLPGQCNASITGVPNFNIARYVGRWRLIESYASDFQVGTCNVARYTLENNNTLGVVNSQVVDQDLRTISGTANITSTDGSGKLLFYFPSRNEYFEYIILDTDYDSYALGYGCVNLTNNQRRVYSWKMSRENTLSAVATNNINQIVNSIEVLDNRYYYIVNRTNSGCFYYPTPENNSTVRFRGQCNQSIPVVTSFDAGRYLGLWHDIESYPVDFQDGTCINAYYSPGNDVDVYNTQVINQTLFSIRGSASLVASTDGSAKLNVTFNVGGFNVTTSYWVLATDYDSYSFVYSCETVDDEYVQVSSWKLSRTKALTSAATTAITNVINTIPVLDQRYFLTRDQSPEGCFYYPEPQLGVPVVFPGQCDNNIAAVPSFNMTLFQGLWHEIEAYPKEEQSGQCINHQFTLNGSNILDLQSSSIFSQTLDLTSGNVTFNSTDGSGRLTITITSDNGTVIQIPYWILSTDYTDYALAYSCVNISNDFRGVWSWKLSRTKQLSAAANTTINNAISNVDVLDNVYYENINQTDRACFYLPDIAPGQTVTLPGQCDPNITGVANFNISRYVGRWRLIQSYGSRFQSGTCNVARYTLENNNTLAYTNAQVLNQGLASISGTANVTSTDGSGKLLFYLPSRNRYYEFIVLDTDYDSYALGYGCVNINAEQRTVTSWKFSRENTLSQAAINNITRIVNSIDVLHEPYYYTVNRTEAGCFYFPTANSNTTVRFRGQCDESIPTVANFDVGRYLGLWHDIESYPVPFQDGSCPNAYYAPYNSSSVTVFNTHVVNQTLGVIEGIATVASTDGSAKLNVTFNVLGFNVTTNYWVLATDYDSYAFVYSCAAIDDEYISIASWKLSRTKALTTAATTAINNIMNNYTILDQRYYINRNQSSEGCFYFPEPQAGVPVVFPGQCDNNIAAVSNFNMTLFQGIWHEIAAYPKEEQPGQCINHQFTLNATNTLHLDSLNVVNQTLTTTSGQVTFNTSDGSGRLIINITADGQIISIPYWILNTDYTGYALAYSCVNINSDFRGVWSWKLSRTKQLSAAANTAINNAISNIDVLGNEYYENIQQTDSACFHLPELGPNDPVVFPGQCDPNIPVLRNFNESRYLGSWRLIESYYSDFQEGTCNTATYTAADDGSVIVFNTKVVDEQLNSITGSAVLATTDGSAKLLVTFPSSAEPMDYWILDTDYDSYALIYTCVNITSDQRRVWSWKMSRTNTLTVNAVNAINQVVNSVDVLDDRYYQTVNRTDAACFYYPTPNNETNVVFPGQCDESIPAVANFNASAYEGLWYDVESYPTSFQRGTCNSARYTLTSGGIINVVNTQVVDQVLQTMSGYAVAASTDGSAKLNVTFALSSGNVTTNYWILATDYTSYSFVYSCRNINNESRAVYSWKLGRQPTLLPAATTAINNVVNSVQVLDQQYFIQRNHTEDACFFYPDNEGGDVILNGQCVPDAQVQVITGFNPTSFAGTWHEVARFPSTLQNGECTATQYSLTGANTFNVIQTSVINESLLNTSTQANVASDGRGVISISLNGVPFNDVYILASDYSEYALAYSCRNLTNSTKQVYSWKLSRSRAGLSVAANNVINQLVRDNIDLFEPYYRNTGQDNAACFYYPVFDQLPGIIELPGPCNTSIRAVSNFNTSAYLGRWFEVARYPQRAQTGQCNRAEYTGLGGSMVTVVNSQVVNMTLASITGSAFVVSTDGSGILQVTFVVGGQTRFVNYYVLATDYNSYALVYTCVDLDNGNRHVGSWKLSRNRTLDAQAYAVIDSVISNTQGLNQSYYQPTSQSDEDCFYVPEMDPYQAPLFRGQCENITGVAGFNADRYLGWWHEIERYPSDSNVGECTSSWYEASGNTIQVMDTDVFNYTSITVNGTVTVTNDGRLRRVLNDNRVQDFWVLATDYDTYALLYSCTNVNDEYRRVWSAKHSKARSLTQAAQNAMAPAIENNRLLYPQFYQSVDQSDSACFHYPTQTGAQVILPGQCDRNITVVQNFNMANFQGTWYQIARYDAVQGSTCIGNRYVYNAASGNIDVLDFEVINGALVTTEGSGRVNSTDGSGRLSIVLPVAGTNNTVTTSLYILATEYNDYALAYSCVNIDEFRRQVGVWQLSRARTLSANGVIAINSVATQREELHLPYFNQISQDTECPDPSSAFLFKSSIIVILVCTVVQLVM